MVTLEPPESTLSCFGTCFKWTLYLFNVLLLCGGIAAIGVGVWATVDETSNRVVVLTDSELYINGAITLISAGTAAIFLSVFGCCGARFENKCMLIGYCVVLLMIIVTEFAAAVLALAYYTQIETFANAEMRDAILEKYGQGTHIDSTDAFNYMQLEFDCCGYAGDSYDGAQLYQASLWYLTNFLQVPSSCCTRDDEGEPVNLFWCQHRDNTHMAHINNWGCKEAVIEQGGNFSTMIAGISIGLGVGQLFGIVLVFCLLRQL